MRIVELVCEKCENDVVNDKLTFYVCYCSGNKDRPEILEGGLFRLAVFIPSWFYENLAEFFDLEEDYLPDYTRERILSRTLRSYKIIKNGYRLVDAVRVHDKTEKYTYLECYRCLKAPDDHYCLYKSMIRCTSSEKISEYVQYAIDGVYRLWKFYVTRKVIKHEMIRVTIQSKVEIATSKDRLEILKKELQI
ncbi:MAG TPA: hypothetical protein ENG66_06580 [Thermococcus sp.]|nr:MAG: hypothetical protein DRP04_07925 [Archaeoglobales archaeon]HDH45036.1 hypothetical protein [Thermococcus sp.]